MRDCPHRPNQAPMIESIIVVSIIQPVKVPPPPPKGRGTGRVSTIFGRTSTGFGRGRRVPNRGMIQVEARQPSLVYTVRRHEGTDDVDIIAGTSLYIHYHILY